MKWISSRDSLPKVCETVLICMSNYQISTGHLSRRRPKPEWKIDAELEEKELSVKYWMPLDFPFPSVIYCEEK